ncbi:MAG TPA: hypothetical protein VIP11_26750, partial [Gemmatimonadaceae bacterium]
DDIGRSTAAEPIPGQSPPNQHWAGSGAFSFPGTRLAAAIPKDEPLFFHAGDTVRWTRSVTDYPSSDGWTLKYAFRGAGKIDVTAVPDAAGYLATISSDVSDVAPGLYEWSAFVEKDGTPIERHVVANGRVQIKAGLANVGDTSRQAHAERMLAAVEAQLEDLAASPIESYTIEQQATVRRNMAELEKTRNRYRLELQRLRRPGKKLPDIVVRLGRA